MPHHVTPPIVPFRRCRRRWPCQPAAAPDTNGPGRRGVGLRPGPFVEKGERANAYSDQFDVYSGPHSADAMRVVITITVSDDDRRAIARYLARQGIPPPRSGLARPSDVRAWAFEALD